MLFRLLYLISVVVSVPIAAVSSGLFLDDSSPKLERARPPAGSYCGDLDIVRCVSGKNFSFFLEHESNHDQYVDKNFKQEKFSKKHKGYRSHDNQKNMISNKTSSSETATKSSLFSKNSQTLFSNNKSDYLINKINVDYYGAKTKDLISKIRSKYSKGLFQGLGNSSDPIAKSTIKNANNLFGGKQKTQIDNK